MEYAGFFALPIVAGDSAGIRTNAEHLRPMMVRRGLAPRFMEVPGAHRPSTASG